MKSFTYPLEKFTWWFIRALLRRKNKHFTFDYVSRIFVLKELKDLKKQKATSNAKLPLGLIKDFVDIFVVPLVYIINLSMKTSTVPSVHPRDIEILGWCPVGSVLPHGEKVAL